MTGADSPVIAASFTEAIPSMTSPSDGMVSPASTRTTSPTFRSVPDTSLKSFRFAPDNNFACVSVRVLRNDSACALPRPSAIASAKLANRTVNQSHTMIWNVKARFPPPVTRSRMKMTVVRIVTTSTTNMTGLRNQGTRIELDECRLDRRQQNIGICQSGRRCLRTG